MRSTASQLKAARLPNYRDLAGFDFAWQARSARRSRVNSTAASSWRTPTMLVGGHGPFGKLRRQMHLATAIGVQAIEHHRKRVRFFSTVELVNALEQESFRANPARAPHGSPTPISSSSTSLATFRSAPPAKP